MPPKFLFDVSSIDLGGLVVDKQGVLDAIPQRGDFEQLDGIVFNAPPYMMGVRRIRDDEFWVKGHIPGRPLFPGVLMIEASAQMAAFYCRHNLKMSGFVGFGGVDAFKFRQSVEPGQTLYLLVEHTKSRHSRVMCTVQGMVNGQLVFEGEITGVVM